MINQECYPSIEWIRLAGVVRVLQDPSTTHQINLGLREGPLGGDSKAQRAWSEPGSLEYGGLEGLIRSRGARHTGSSGGVSQTLRKVREASPQVDYPPKP